MSPGPILGGRTVLPPLQSMSSVQLARRGGRATGNCWGGMSWAQFYTSLCWWSCQKSFKSSRHQCLNVEFPTEAEYWSDPCRLPSSHSGYIAQLVEHLTVDCAGIRWSLAQFRVAGFFCHTSCLLPPPQTLSPAHAVCLPILLSSQSGEAGRLRHSFRPVFSEMFLLKQFFNSSLFFSVELPAEV